MQSRVGHGQPEIQLAELLSRFGEDDDGVDAQVRQVTVLTPGRSRAAIGPGSQPVTGPGCGGTLLKLRRSKLYT